MPRQNDRHSGLNLQIKYAGMVWLLVAQITVMLPFMLVLPKWLLPVLLACTAWRLRILSGHWAQPGRLFKGVTISLGLLALFSSGLDPLSLDAMSTLLLLAFAFKSLELRARRDAVVVVFTGYFLVSVQFLYDQSIGAALYGLACLILLTAALLAIQESPNKKVSDHLKLAATLMAQCLPLMIILYLFFPRLPPLWAVSLPGDQAISGISDRMAPGDIANLSQSDATAFRVSFENGERPAQRKLYWRGLVLNHFDGRSWTQFATAAPVEGLKRILRVNPSARKPNKEALEYKVIYEPTQQNWLFTLSTVIAWKGAAWLGYDYRLTAQEALRSPTEFTLFSDINTPRDRQPNARLIRQTLRIPDSQNPRARALAMSWRTQSNSDQAYAQKVMAHFRDQPFSYTLRPSATGSRDTIDQFLFETRAGFCSHYAGSFVYMMRAAGIPARVVLGYQGGEWNEAGDFLTVRQYDAHAWTEIWLQGEWVRFDPTAMVAPDRIEQNLQTAVRAEGSFLEKKVFSMARIVWLSRLRQQWDAVQYGWRKWVLGYDNKLQSRWLEKWLGKVTIERVALMFGGLLGLILLGWLLMLGYMQSSNPDSPGLRLYKKFCRKLEKYGLSRPLDSTPGQFACLAISTFPQRTDSITEVTRVYESLIYSQPSAEQQLSLLKRLKIAVDRV
jgi:transglutaminase-like putative cysteine protease